MKRFLTILVACSLSTAAGAQAPGQTPPKPNQQQQQRETKRERVKKRIRALRAYTLTEELGLDETDAGKLFPVLAKFDDDFDRLLTERQQLQQQLDGAGNLKDKRAIDKLIDQALANQRATWDVEDKRIAEIRKILTPAQVARMLIVLPALERRIQNQLRNAVGKMKNGGGGGKRRQMGDDDDGDDDVEPNEKPNPPKRPAQKAGNPAATPCDPFSSRTGCAR
ncbi:MAG TPA: hypothetical protein VF403_16025 [Kofleriaceae bacterium]